MLRRIVFNPNGVASQFRRQPGRNPVGVVFVDDVSQGSSFLATLGFVPESLWDSSPEFPKGIATSLEWTIADARRIDRMKLDLEARMVFLYAMNAAIASGGIRDIQSQARDIARRQLQQWFDWMDHMLDIHRSNFVFRPPTPQELDEHKTALKAAIRTSHLIYALIADPDFNASDLTARLQVRIRQLPDAYGTFHDATLSDEQAGDILKQVFPE